MDQEWEYDWYRVQEGVHQSCMYKRGLYTGDSRRWGIHRWSRSTHTETFVVGNCRTPWSPFFVFVRVPCEDKYKSEWFRPEDDTRVERRMCVPQMDAFSITGQIQIGYTIDRSLASGEMSNSRIVSLQLVSKIFLRYNSETYGRCPSKLRHSGKVRETTRRDTSQWEERPKKLKDSCLTFNI